jgi:beta-glucosidase
MKLKNVTRGKCKLFGGLTLIALQLVYLVAAQPSTVAQFEYSFQNPNLSAEERADNAVSLMTLDEKINFLHFRAGVHRLGIPPLNSAEGLHGEALGGVANWTPHRFG